MTRFLLEVFLAAVFLAAMGAAVGAGYGGLWVLGRLMELTCRPVAQPIAQAVVKARRRYCGRHRMRLIGG